ncbi:ABC transporter ATP-binding protein [Agrobacterium radiobacter]|uniref:ABC transporter ATP-binding protein n=1 Tax=Agrobacterium tumefaciens complex TaxID=1183400 RepID=UPI001CBA8A42|nr:ABC transporter ATP-binding protein [Agrobacterium tumefaciens]
MASNVVKIQKTSDEERPESQAKPSKIISIEGLTKRYPRRGGEPVTIFEDLWLPINKGEFVCILGHSGCGKTTVLNILAGLAERSEGTIIAAGKEVRGPSLERAVIFQGHALLPWMTVLGNVSYAVRARNRTWSKAQVREHAMAFIAKVGLSQAAEKYPSELSGGMKQRVGIARALSIEPSMLLMDEPFSALDALTRGKLQDEVRRICKSTDQTVLMITHDVDEAIYLADKIVLMTNGPNARVAEIVRTALPSERQRNELHHLSGYYELRNHLMDFLVTRSASFDVQEATAKGWSSRRPPVIEVPTLE